AGRTISAAEKKTAAYSLLNPASAIRRRRRPMSFGDFGISRATRSAAAVGAFVSVVGPATAPPAPPAPSSSSFNRRRPGAVRSSTTDASAPATMATMTNTAPSAIVRSGVMTSVLDVHEFADDQGSNHLQHDGPDDHLHAEWIVHENNHLARIDEEERERERRRQGRQHPARHAAVRRHYAPLPLYLE